jgi:hypothetical protein
MKFLGRGAFLLFVAMAVGAAAWGYYYLKQARPPSESALSVIPAGCVIYASCNDIRALDSRLNEQSLVADHLRSVPEMAPVFSALHELDSVLTSSEELAAQVAGNNMHFALYPPTGQNVPEWLFCCNISSLGKERFVREALHAAFRADHQDGSFRLARHGARVRLRNGVVAISNSAKLLDKTGDAESYFSQTPAYRSFAGALAPGSDPSLFIDHGAYRASYAKHAPCLSMVIQSGCSASRLFTTPSGVRLSGFVSGDTSLVSSLVSRAAPIGRDDLLRMIPLGISSFTAMAVKDGARVITADSSAFWKEVSERAMFNASREFASLCDGLLFTMEFGSAKVAGYAIRDSARARAWLESASDTLNGKGTSRVYRLSASAAAVFLPYSDARISSALLLGNIIYMGDDAAALENVAGKITGELSLYTDKSFMSYALQHVPSQFQFVIYSDPAMAAGSGFLAFSSPESRSIGNAFRHAMFALACDSDGTRFRLQLTSKPGGMQGPQAQGDGRLWTHALDTSCAARPTLFVNHQSGENELLIVDNFHALYLIDAKGRRIWKKRISEPPVTPLYRVDALRNGKFQVLFASAHYLHLLDRKGNYLAGFPMKLPSAPTSPLSLIDYDGRRDFRVLVACGDRRIYCFTLNGARPEGFAPPVVANDVKLGIRHVRAGASDFLIAIDNEGKIYCFNRKGASRLSLRNRATMDCDGFHVEAGKGADDTFIYYVDEKSGNLNRISLADKKELIALKLSQPALGADFVARTGDKRPMVLITHSSSVSAHDLTGNLLWQRSLETDLSEGSLFGDQTHMLLYGYSSARSAIHAVDPESGKSFSHAASAPGLVTNLFRDGKSYLIFADGRELICTQP